MSGNSTYNYCGGGGAESSSSRCEVHGGGSSSSYYYSTSGSSNSNSSSVENISTSSSIENGDQLTITFIPKKCPGSRCLSPLLQEVFAFEEEVREMCSSREGIISPVVVETDKPVSASSSSSVWLSDIKNGVSSLLKTVRNDDECGSSSSGYSQAIQHLSGDGILLRSLEKGAPFPYLHLSTSSVCLPPPSLIDESNKIKQGIYKEIKRVIPPDSWIRLDSDNHGKSTWLFLGFKTLDKNNEVLEQFWKEWTGVRHLYLQLRTDIHIRRISFFRRRDPVHCLDTFFYVAFIEIGSISGKTNRWLLDYVQRARLERLQRTMIVFEEMELWETDSGIPQAYE